MAEYDSRMDTLKHIDRVRELLKDAEDNLFRRATDHDKSKLGSPEREIFDQVTPRLKGLTYGSDEYKAQLKEMGVALEHHYKHNRHHPEFHADGIKGMSLLDLIEMACDWKAATERHANGCMLESLRINKQRFGIDDQLWAVLYNTAVELGMLGVPSEEQ